MDFPKSSVLLVDGTGSFGTATGFPVGDTPSSVAVGNFNADSFQDLTVVNQVSGGTLSILLGDGTGSFGTATQFVVGNTPLSVFVVDINDDTFLDLAITNDGDTVSVFLGEGTGSFTGPNNFALKASLSASVVAGYFN